ncbi:MAG: radical SAM protein [Candidatus Kerfeldbacteria bacterium]|nr:radical SAM protein [Candidatus Kerfeldbacteria bacterium]
MIAAIKRKVALENAFAASTFVYRPEYLSLISTFRCNFACEMCSIWKKTDFSDEMTDEQWLRLVPEFPKIFSPEAFVEITGGEPMIRKALVLALIPTLKKHFRGVSLNSNGSLLFDPDAIPSLERAGLDTMKISCTA